jgi:hypothetical protein
MEWMEYTVYAGGPRVSVIWDNVAPDLSASRDRNGVGRAYLVEFAFFFFLFRESDPWSGIKSTHHHLRYT